MLDLDNYRQRTTISISSPNTPGMSVDTPDSHSTPREEEMTDASRVNAMKIPSPLCKWSIHQPEIPYTQLPSPSRSPPENLNLQDEESWPMWPASPNPKDFTEKLSNGLQSNDFSNVRIDDLPIAVNQIARAAQRSPDELRKDALGFGIMSRNVELVEKLLENSGLDFESSRLYPFHLAISYLDGSKTCCSVLEVIEAYHPPSLRKLYVNDDGHTVLDYIMIAILKAHTSCVPGVVDVIFKKEKRFEGEDVDICGRWDADSDCVRTLLANGIAGIPSEWKHMFCHTSVQAICHCIGTIFAPLWGPDINTSSGLFVRRCTRCGLKMQLLPLHTLVLVGFHLAQSGCKDETLFGILACLLCLSSNGANPLLKANISVQALLGSEDVNECSHEELDPAEFAEMMPAGLTLTWSKELRTGWQVVCKVFKISQAVWKDKPSRRRATSKRREYDDEVDTFVEYSEDDMDTDEEASRNVYLPAECPDSDLHSNFFGQSEVLASLWAAVQTELLTYRRLEEGDAWMSPNFNMEALYKSLNSGANLAIALVQNEMMKPFCGCGKFAGAIPACALVDEACACYFSNLEDWNRTTALWSPVDREAAACAYS